MQWLIDIAIEAMEQYLIDNPRYVDRGDPGVVDFAKANFIRDGNWYELDLSAIVPENAVAIAARAELVSDSVDATFAIRRHGNANTEVISEVVTQVGGIRMPPDWTCAVDEDRKIDYKVYKEPNYVFYIVNLVIKGWWL